MMTNVSEAAQGSTTPMAGALQQGVETISLNQTVSFELYVRLVLPADGYVFWVKASALSKTSSSSAFNVLSFNSTLFNDSGSNGAPEGSFQAAGSFHYITDAQQNEDDSSSQDRIVFTSEEPVQNLNAISPDLLYIGTFTDTTFGEAPADATPLRFAFSGRNSHYQQAGLWHYTGTAIYSTMEPQIIDDPGQLNTQQLIVSNSLPAWISFNSYAPAWPVPVPRPGVVLYPSFLVPDNLPAPYGTVHIDPAGTESWQEMPGLDPMTGQSQLAMDRVTITLFGCNNQVAQDLLYSIMQYSFDTEIFGILNMPVIRDDKESQVEIHALAQKKLISFEVSYVQGQVRDVARQLILSCIPEFILPPVPVLPEPPLPPVYFPFPELTLIADLDFQHDQYYSDKLGFITANQAVLSWAVDPFGNRIQPTPGTTYLAFNADGTLQRIPQGSPRIGNGRGLWAENLRGGRIDYNTRLNGAAWIVDGVTVAQDMPTVYSNDATLAWSARATKDNATIYQNVLPIALGAGVNTSIPYALFRIPSGTALLGRVDFSVDNWVTSVNIAPRLNSQRWVQLAGPIQDLIAGNTLKYGLKFEKAGDKVGFMLGMADRGNVMRTPVETPSTPNVNVPGDFTTIRTENFSSMWDREEITVLIVCEPRADPLPDPTLQVGWTVFEMNNAYNIAAVGTGGIIDNVMTVATYTSGAFTEGTRMTVGTGVLSYTDIQRQLTPPDGPYGRQGTYLTSTTLSQHQTTSRQDIILQARIKDAQGNALNAATKPLDPIRPYARRIGLTATNELENVNTGDDPQNEDYNYNEPNAEGYTMNFRPADLYAASALKGDVQVFDTSPPHFTAAPVFNSTAQLALGCQGPYGGGSLNGPLSRIVIYGRAAAPPEMSKQTLALQIAAEQEIATLLAA